MNKGIESKLYKAYLFFLPLEMFIRYEVPLQSYLFSMFSCFFFWPGFLLMVCGKRKMPISSLLKGWRKLTWFQSIYTFFMACILFIPLGPLNGENTIRASIGMIIFGIIVLMHISYNVYAFTHLITWKQAEKIFYKSIYVLLFVGYLQFATIRIGGPFASFYYALGNVLFLTDNLERGICFFGSEPSVASTMFFLSIPFLAIKVLNAKILSLWKNRDLLFLGLFVPLFLSSNSSSVLLSLVMVAAVFICMFFRYRLFYNMCLLSSFLIGMLLAVVYGLGDVTFQGKTADQDDLNYILLGKITDTENASTMMRSSTIVNDMKIFFKYPLTGVGDGLQGYWYNENIPTIYLNSSEVDDLVRGKNGIADGGGAYFPLMLSAYGLIGVLFLILYLGDYKKYIFPSKNENTTPVPIGIFQIFICVFLSSGWFVVGIRQNFLVCFALSLPIIYQVKSNQKTTNSKR